MPTRNINLTEHYDDFVTTQISAGKFHNASEVMRAGLRLLEQQAQEDAEKLALLRTLAAEGLSQLDQGRGIVLKDFDALQTHIQKLSRRGAAMAKRRARGA